jgi:hypothetical protein
MPPSDSNAWGSIPTNDAGERRGIDRDDLAAAIIAAVVANELYAAVIDR